MIYTSFDKDDVDIELDFMYDDEARVASESEEDDVCCNDFHCPCGNANNYRGEV